jgi:hypothetical protein
LSFDRNKVKKILGKKLEIKGIQFNSMSQIFPEDLEEILVPY